MLFFTIFQRNYFCGGLNILLYNILLIIEFRVILLNNSIKQINLKGTFKLPVFSLFCENSLLFLVLVFGF